MINFVGLFICSALLELAWVLSVKSVEKDNPTKLVLMAVGMQTIMYVQTKLLIDSGWEMISGIVGAGTGAIVGIKIPFSSKRTNDPSNQ